MLLIIIKTYKVLYADVAAPEYESSHSVMVSSLGRLVQGCLSLLKRFFILNFPSQGTVYVCSKIGRFSFSDFLGRKVLHLRNVDIKLRATT